MRDILDVLVTSKNKEYLNKNEGARVATTLNIVVFFFTQSRADNSAVKGRIWLKFELIRDVMAILFTSKYEEDPIKNVGARVFTTLKSHFPNAQGQGSHFPNAEGQATPQSMVESC